MIDARLNAEARIAITISRALIAKSCDLIAHSARVSEEIDALIARSTLAIATAKSLLRS